MSSYNPHGKYVLIRIPSHPRADNRGYVPVHILVAEALIGTSIPKGNVVHHVDEDVSNNSPGNLVVCQDEAYHRLLHTRKKAIDVCGNPNYRSCVFCHRYDDPLIMFHSVTSRHYMHRECRQKYERKTRRSHCKEENLTS